MDAERVVLQALSLWRRDRIYVAFNGGKDSTVLLWLLMKCCGGQPGPINAVWFKSDQEFAEITRFVAEQKERYNLNLLVYEGGYREKLGEFLEDVDSRCGDPAMVLLGFRSSDNSRQRAEHFMPGDIGTRPFLRCHPILDWSYGDVWKYIDTHKIEVCSLYDQGYSSVGDVKHTTPNPLLKNKHARELSDWSSERSLTRT